MSSDLVEVMRCLSIESVMEGQAIEAIVFAMYHGCQALEPRSESAFSGTHCNLYFT